MTAYLAYVVSHLDTSLVVGAASVMATNSHGTAAGRVDSGRSLTPFHGLTVLNLLFVQESLALTILA